MRERIAVAFTPLLVGCHSFVPLTTATPLPGTYVAATLTEAGSAQVSGHLGPDAGVVRGRLLDDGQEGMTLSVQSVGLRRREELGWRGEAGTLPHASVARIDTRRFAKGRSLLLLAGGGTALVAPTAKSSRLRGSGEHTSELPSLTYLVCRLFP